MAFNLPPLVAGILSILPVAVFMFVAYAPYDGFFRDNVIFLFFVGGLILGGFLSLLGLYFLISAPWLFIVGFPLVVKLVATAALNRRKWRGEAHSVFNGGTLGLGIAAVWSLTLLVRVFELEGRLNLVVAGSALLAVTGIAGIELATTAYLGSGVADRTPFRTIGIATIASIPLAALTFLWNNFVRTAGYEPASYVWGGLAALYGIVAVVYARRHVVPLGLSPEARKRRRREARAGSGG